MRSMLLLLIVLLLAAPVAHAFIQPDERLPDPAQEARAEALGQIILCPVCDGQAINGSNAEVAVAMRAALRDQLQRGASDAEILRWFSERYGIDIISHPPFTPGTGVLWLMPVLILTIFGIFFWQQRRAAKK